jgi:LysM repeat protein
MKKIWNQYSYAIILVLVSFSVAFILSNHSENQEKYTKVTVSEGDSLWKISQQYAGQHSLSSGQFVNWVKKHNNIDGDHIYPGEKILIPVSNSDSAPTEFAGAEENK